MKASELFDVRGVVTAVTGGASGIGFACAEVMADNGAAVELIDVDPQALQASVMRLREAGALVQGEVADVTDPVALKSAFDHIVARHGRLDVVFVNAGIAGGRLRSPEARKPFEDAAPLKRICTPRDIQGAALFLASPASEMMTGAEILIDGGLTLGRAD